MDGGECPPQPTETAASGGWLRWSNKSTKLGAVQLVWLIPWLNIPSENQQLVLELEFVILRIEAWTVVKQKWPEGMKEFIGIKHFNLIFLS